MKLFKFLDRGADRKQRPQRVPHSRPAVRPPSFRPRLECLEDRTAPAVWVVNLTTDTGGPNGTGQGNGNTGDLRYCINSASSGDTIYFDQGLNGQTTQLNKQIVLSQNLTIVGETPTQQAVNVTISGQNNTRIFEVGLGNDTITSLIFSGGNGSGGNGGAILVDSGADLTLNTDSFNGNKGANNGGAIENDGALSVYGSSFSGNASAGNGGAIENTGLLTVGASQGSTQSTFSSHTATVSGGAIDSNGNGRGNVQVSNSTFLSNSAQQGGAINTDDPTTLTSDTFGAAGQPNTGNNGGGAIMAQAEPPNYLNVQLNVTNCTFTSNQANANGGGAIYTTAPTDVELSTFTKNSSPGYGGAIDSTVQNLENPPVAYNSTFKINLDQFMGDTAGNGGAVASIVEANAGGFQTIVTNDTFAGQNSATSGTGLGGALYISQTTTGSSTATATLINDTFFQNSSNGHGGAIALVLTDTTGKATPQSTAQLTSLTVYQNTAATDSGGLYVNSALQNSVSVDNSILSGNTVTAANYNGPVDVTLTNAGTLNDLGYNLVGTSDNMFTNLTNPNKTDTPGLANNLAQNGAPASYPPTLALQNTSPGFRKGDPALAGTTDERGFTRQAGKVSIGAEDPDAVQGG